MDAFAKLQAYLSAVMHRWKTVLAVTLFSSATLAGVVYSLPNNFSATTTILVDPQKVPDRYVTTTVTEDPNERLSTLTQEVLSRTRLTEIINKFHLYPKLREKKGDSFVLSYMRTQVQIQVKKTTGASLSAFTITYHNNDRLQVAAVTNQLAESFIDWNLEQRQSLVEGTNRFLAEELARARADLQSQETRVRDFRLNHLGEMPEQMQANLETLARLQAEAQAHTDSMNRLDQERLALMQDPSAATSIVAPAALTPRQRLRNQMSEARKEVDDLAARYTEQHPDLIAARSRLSQLSAQLEHSPADASEALAQVSTGGSEINSRIRLLEQQRKQQSSDLAALQQKMRHYQELVDAVPVREAEVSGLMRDYDSAKLNYSSLLEKSYSAEMATELERKQQAERFQILDSAIPPDRADSPNRPLLYLVSLFGSLVLGFVVAIVLENIDGSIKTEEDLRLLLPPGVSLLGTIPQLRSMGDFPAPETWSTR